MLDNLQVFLIVVVPFVVAALLIFIIQKYFNNSDFVRILVSSPLELATNYKWQDQKTIETGPTKFRKHRSRYPCAFLPYANRPSFS